MEKLDFGDLIANYPQLQACSDAISSALSLLAGCFRGDGRLYLCGNGGSAADCEHIVGELMKGFLLPRRIPQVHAEKLGAWSAKLQMGLPSMSLSMGLPFSTAVSNDNGADLAFAQALYGLGRPGDVLWGISTSGDSENVFKAFKVAQLLGLKTIALTGKTGGKIACEADVAIRVPATHVRAVQEYHLPVYHAICASLESYFFSEA